MKAHFEQLFSYDRWANQEIFSLIKKREPENARIYVLFSHIISAERIWLDRCMNKQDTVERFMDRSIDEMTHALSSVENDWLAFLPLKSADDFDAIIHYSNSSGKSFSDACDTILTHVINHGTYHRAQIVQLVKAEGFEVPNTDYIFYKRMVGNGK